MSGMKYMKWRVIEREREGERKWKREKCKRWRCMKKRKCIREKWIMQIDQYKFVRVTRNRWGEREKLNERQKEKLDEIMRVRARTCIL